jgi:hypothetical protein
MTCIIYCVMSMTWNMNAISIVTATGPIGYGLLW